MRFLLICMYLCIFQSWIRCNAEYEKYCVEKGGEVLALPAGFFTYGGLVDGITRQFCEIPDEGNLALVGLETFASDKPSLAATYVKTLKIDNPHLIKGPYAHPGVNICYALGGSFILDGGFHNELGFSSVCFFGDGSNIDGWTLLYACMGSREDIRTNLKGKVLHIPIPNIYE